MWLYEVYWRNLKLNEPERLENLKILKGNLKFRVINQGIWENLRKKSIIIKIEKDGITRAWLKVKINRRNTFFL